MSNGHDDKYRSRKWRIAVLTDGLATIVGFVILAATVFACSTVWETVVDSVLWFLFGVYAVTLTGYGFQNVITKWSPTGKEAVGGSDG